PPELLELRLLGRHQELEHETASRSAKILGETPEAGRLAAVQGGVPLGVVTDEHLAEGRAELLDVADKLLAVLEIELLLPAFLDRGRGEISLARGVAQDRGAELLVDEDTGTLLRDAGGDGGLETVVDHPLGVGDARRLLRPERPLPAEQTGLERAAMVERQDVQRAIVPEGHTSPPLPRSAARSQPARSPMRSIAMSGGGWSATSGASA